MARTSPYQINDHDELDHVPEPPRPYHAVTPPNARGVYLRVVISYATAHGAVTSLLDVASSAMSDPTLGADASALFYLCYSLSGLLLAVPIIDHFGVARSGVRRASGQGLRAYFQGEPRGPLPWPGARGLLQLHDPERRVHRNRILAASKT